MKNLAAQIDFLEAQLSKASEQKRKSKLFKTKFIVGKAQEPQNVDEIKSQLEKLKHELASRKIFACIKHMGRNIKQFKSSEPQKIKKRLKATPEKKIMLEKELAIVEGMNVEQWAEYVSRAQLSKKFSSLVSFEKRKMDAEENNVYARICKATTVKACIDSTVKSISQWVEADVSEPVVDTTKQETKVAQPEVQPAPGSESAAKPKNGGKTSATSEIQHQEARSEPEPESESESGSESEAEDAMVDDFFVTSDGGALPQLANGYISGSEDESEPEAIKPERKNRRGQRARRAMWEKRYGTAAKHVAKQREEEQALELAKKRKREFKIQKERQRIEQQKALEAKPIHPSWAAKQQQEKLKFVKPAGKKIVFD